MAQFSLRGPDGRQPQLSVFLPARGGGKVPQESVASDSDELVPEHRGIPWAPVGQLWDFERPRLGERHGNRPTDPRVFHSGDSEISEPPLSHRLGVFVAVESNRMVKPILWESLFGHV